VNISHMHISKSSCENLKMRLRYTGSEEDIAVLSVAMQVDLNCLRRILSLYNVGK
jgi:hypothetical protein